MIDSLEFINGHVDLYCGHDIYSYNINDLYIIRYMGVINKGYSLEYILHVKGIEDKFILSINQLDIFTKIGVEIL